MRRIPDPAPASKRDIAVSKFERARQCFAEGVALHGRGKLADAKACFAEVLALQPRHAEALHALGVIEAQAGNPKHAVELIDQALEIRPDYALAYFNRGNALKEAGQFDAALSSYDRAIAIKPDFTKAANSRRQLRKWQLQADPAPKFAEADAASQSPLQSAAELYKCGMRLMKIKNYSGALANYDQAIAIKPNHAEAHHARGFALKKLGKYEEALASYGRAVAIKPGFAEAHVNRGVTLQEMKQLDAALASYEQAIAVKPDFAMAHINRGNLLWNLQQMEAAIASYDRGLELMPDNKEALNSRGVALHALKQLDAAIASYRRALAVDPSFASGHWNLSNALLLKGDFENGWKHFEWRWKNTGIDLYKQRRDFSQPLWSGGESLAGKTILLHAEQGLGDTLQFCRYAKCVADLGARVILEVYPSLHNVLQGLEGVSVLLPENAELPAFDFHCPLLSLPLAFKTDLNSIPRSASYIHSDRQLTKHWRQKLGKKSKPRVGLVWSGSLKHKGDGQRSIALNEMLKLLSADFEFVSLQKEVRKSDAAVLRMHPEIRDFSAELHDFTDTAAICELMDLVISVDTSTAHLAGAMGKPVWILLPFVPDWRWLLDRDDTPWYPGARLYRQARPGDWAGVLSRVGKDLAATMFEGRRRV